MDRNIFLWRLRKISLMVGDSWSSRCIRIYRQRDKYFLELKEKQEITKAEFEEIALLFYDAGVFGWEVSYVDRSVPRTYDWGLEIEMEEDTFISNGENKAPQAFRSLLDDIRLVIADRIQDRHHPIYKA